MAAAQLATAAKAIPPLLVLDSTYCLRQAVARDSEPHAGALAGLLAASAADTDAASCAPGGILALYRRCAFVGGQVAAAESMASAAAAAADVVVHGGDTKAAAACSVGWPAKTPPKQAGVVWAD